MLQEADAAEEAAAVAREHVQELQQRCEARSAALDAEAAELQAKIDEAMAPVAEERAALTAAYTQLEREVDELRLVSISDLLH